MTRRMTELEARIHENGCRLIPGVSHNRAEWIRHRNRYRFFRDVIVADLSFGDQRPTRNRTRSISVVDLGCGVGYGSAILAEIPRSSVIAIDLSSETIAYASRHYRRPNIEYQVGEIHEFVEAMEESDYLVAHEVVEHLGDGFEVLRHVRFRKLLLVSTPYAEAPGANKHHRVSEITEANYSAFRCKQFFYGDLRGRVYVAEHTPESPLTLICVAGTGEGTWGAGLRHWGALGDGSGAAIRMLRRALPSWLRNPR